jgi:hypothetical protein
MPLQLLTQKPKMRNIQFFIYYLNDYLCDVKANFYPFALKAENL